MDRQANDGTGAAVVGEGLMSFLPGVSQEVREDILLANYFAQTKTLHDYQSGLVKDWFSYYKNQLKFLGWDSAPPPNVIRPDDELAPLVDDERERLVDSALAQIGRDGRQHYADSSAQGLEALLANEQALELFEHNTRTSDSVRFHLIPCVQTRGSHIDMVLYHHELDTTSSVRSFLLGTQSPKMRTIARHIELVRFNTRLFREGMREKVLKSTRAQIRGAIIDLL